jgi:hypothetical protein
VQFGTGVIWGGVSDKASFQPYTPIVIWDGERRGYLAMLHVCLDDSGSLDTETICFAGWISSADYWTLFQTDWNAFLSQSGIPYLHTADFMHQGGADKLSILEKAAGVIHSHVFAGVACAVDCAAFRASQKVSQQYGNNAKLFCFQTTVKLLIESLVSLEKTMGLGKIPPMGLLFDDSEEYAMQCYKLLNKVKVRNPEWRDRIGSICFVKDEVYVPLQAADVLAWLTHQKLKSGYAGQYDYLVGKMREGRDFLSHFYDAETLRELEEKI